MKSKKDKWIKILNDWEKSGLIRAQYCREKLIPVSTFDYWRQRIRKEVTDTKSESDLVRLPIMIKSEKPKSFTLETSEGLKIHIPTDCPSDEIKKLILVIQEAF